MSEPMPLKVIKSGILVQRVPLDQAIADPNSIKTLTSRKDLPVQ
jgi:hypothetical protein